MLSLYFASLDHWMFVDVLVLGLFSGSYLDSESRSLGVSESRSN